MKLLIAHIPPEAVESVRTELLDLGVLRTTISHVHVSDSLSHETLHYRGTALQTHLRPEVRLECLASAEGAPAVVDVLSKHARGSYGLDGNVAVLDVEALHHAAARDQVLPTAGPQPRINSRAGR